MIKMYTPIFREEPKILSKHHTSYDVLSDHLTDKGSLITSDLLSDNEQYCPNSQ